VTPKRPLEIGDRVRIYHAADDVVTATVDNVRGDLVDVVYGGETQVTCGYHRKQVRRLVKRKRRSIWIRERDIPAPLHSGHAVISAAELVGDTYVEFIESKPRKEGVK
jgi:hypothetical protein